MGKKMGIATIILFIMLAPLFTASCPKQTMKADIKDVKDAVKHEPAPESVVVVPAPTPVVLKAAEPVGPSVEELASRAKTAALKTVVNEDG